MPGLQDGIGRTSMQPTGRRERMRTKRMDITTFVNFFSVPEQGRRTWNHGRRGDGLFAEYPYVGYIKGVGHIYQQTVIDTYSKIGFAKLYDRKNALVAADMLNDRVVPFFEQHELKVMRMLTDRGTEYCGNRETHEYELYLAIEDIDHSNIKAKSPQTNGICERFNRTVQNEFYAIAFRKRIYTPIDQLQADLDAWMNSYNTQRTHSGKYCFGKTPMQTFLEGIEVARKYQLQDAAKIQSDEQLIVPSGCESGNSCVSSLQTSDTFFVR